MNFYRLIKPIWGQKDILVRGEYQPNPDFISEVEGPNVEEGIFTEEYITEKNQLGYNIYWFPNHPKEDVYTLYDLKYLSGKYIDQFNYVFVDMDLKDKVYNTKADFLSKLLKFYLKPTKIVDSGNGIHAYWAVSDLTLPDYCSIQQGLINYFKTDESIWTALQLMRVPNTLNTKVHNKFKPCKILYENTNHVYTVNMFTKHVALSDEQKAKVQDHINKVQGKIDLTFSEDVNVDELPNKFIELMIENERIYTLFNDPTHFYEDRSAADLSLANYLRNNFYTKAEIYQILMNTQKALSKGLYRQTYAELTVAVTFKELDEVYKNKFVSVAERLDNPQKTLAEKPYVNGLSYFDCLTKKWQKTNVLGLIGGTGGGKTTLTLNLFKSFIENNPDSDDIYVFFSLEMPEVEIITKWAKLIGNNTALSKRLYVIANEDEKGEPRNIGLQEIVELSSELKKYTGKNLGAVAIDYMGIINPAINLKKKYTFGAEGDKDGKGYGSVRSLSPPSLCKALKPLAKLLDTFLIILTQTTKEKGVGDMPIEKDGAFGSAAFEWTVDYLISIWQPLQRVSHLMTSSYLAWHYAKIRHKSEDDPIKVGERFLLSYDYTNESLNPLTEDEVEEFTHYLPLAAEERKKQAKQNVSGYKNTLNMEKLNRILSRQNQ